MVILIKQGFPTLLIQIITWNGHNINQYVSHNSSFETGTICQRITLVKHEFSLVTKGNYKMACYHSQRRPIPSARENETGRGAKSAASSSFSKMVQNGDVTNVFFLDLYGEERTGFAFRPHSESFSSPHHCHHFISSSLF